MTDVPAPWPQVHCWPLRFQRRRHGRAPVTRRAGSTAPRRCRPRSSRPRQCRWRCHLAMRSGHGGSGHREDGRGGQTYGCQAERVDGAHSALGVHRPGPGHRRRRVPGGDERCQIHRDSEGRLRGRNIQEPAMLHPAAIVTAGRDPGLSGRRGLGDRRRGRWRRSRADRRRRCRMAA